MKRYYTGLLPYREFLRGQPKVHCGVGWRARMAPSPADLRRDFSDPHEIVIHAHSFRRAQAALSSILDAFTVLECVNEWRDEFLAIPADPEERKKVAQDERLYARTLATGSLWDACGLAARASKRRNYAYALALYRLSTTIHANHPRDLEPGLFPYEHRSLNLRDQVRFAYAIVTAYAVVETLGCALHENAFTDGVWIPEKKAELEGRLHDHGVDLNETLVWHVRGPQTKLERKRNIPAVAIAPWSHHPIRDIEVVPVEAIAYLRWLRARAGAHDVTELGYLLSVHDVANAQLLARRLITNIMMPNMGRSRTRRSSQPAQPPVELERST